MIKFEQNRKNCPNRVDRILFHVASYNAISKILLKDEFYFDRSFLGHGKGVYFTQDLDYCWIFGSQNNWRNLNIPKVGEFFSIYAPIIYYDKYGFRRFLGGSYYTPKKNEINYDTIEMSRLEVVKDYRIIDKKNFMEPNILLMIMTKFSLLWDLN